MKIVGCLVLFLATLASAEKVAGSPVALQALGMMKHNQEQMQLDKLGSMKINQPSPFPSLVVDPNNFGGHQGPNRPMPCSNSECTPIQPLTALSSDPGQQKADASDMITQYQTNLKKMYGQVMQQKDQIKAADAQIIKEQKLLVLNKDILKKNEEAVKAYSKEMVALVTKYTDSLSMGAGGEAGASAPAAGASGAAAGASGAAASGAAASGAAASGDAGASGDAPADPAAETFVQKLSSLRKRLHLNRN